MKSLKDAVTLYRTLAAEALSEFSYSERGEALGRRLDDVAWRLSVKVRPPRTPDPDFRTWEQMGWIDETTDFAAILEEVRAAQADFGRAYLDNIDARLYYGTTAGTDMSMAAYVKAKEAPLVERADQLRAQIQPAWEQISALLGDPEKVEWTAPEIRTAAAMAEMREIYAFPQVTMPKFTDFDTDDIEPWQQQVQGSINEMLPCMAAVRAAHETDFLRDVEAATGFHLPVSDPAASVEDNPTT
jgi:hypothetical protein